MRLSLRPLALVGLLVAVVAIRLITTQSTPATAMQVTTIGTGPAGTLRLPQAVAVTPGGGVVAGDQFSGVLTRYDSAGRPLTAVPLPPDPGIGVPASGGVEALPGGGYLFADSTASKVMRLDASGKVLTNYKAGRLHFGYTQYIGGLAGGDVTTAHGKVVVADTANNRLVVFEMGGKLLRTVRLAKGFSLPQGIAESPHGVYVADDLGNRVYELSLTGRVLRVNDLKGHHLNHPYDVAVAPNGQVVVADNSNHAIVVLDKNLRWVRSFGREGSGPGRLRFPRAVAVDSKSRVLVADTSNSRIAMFTLAGHWLGALGTDGRRSDIVTRPSGLTADPRSEIRVADSVTDRITRFGLDGKLLGTMGASQAVTDPVRRDGALSGISGIASVGNGDLLASDSDGLERFGSDGQVRPGDALAQKLHEVSPGVSAIAARAGGGVIAVGRLGGKPSIVAVDPKLGVTSWPLPADGKPKWSGVADGGDGTAWAVSRSPGRAVHVAAGGAVIASIPLPSDPVTNRRGFHSAIEGPEAVAVDPAGHAWIADSFTDNVVALDAQGHKLTSLGSPGRGIGQLLTPAAVAVDCAGGVVVGDVGNARIQRFVGAAPAGICGAPLGPIPSGSHTRLGVDLHSKARAATSRKATWRVSCSRSCSLNVTSSVSVDFDWQRAIAEHRKVVMSPTHTATAEATVSRISSTVWAVSVTADAKSLASARHKTPSPSLTIARAHIDAADSNGLHTTLDITRTLGG